MSSDRNTSGGRLRDLEDGVESALERIRLNDIMARIWRRDHTVWKDDPIEIVDRLGWLSLGDTMAGQVQTLETFASDISSSGFKHVVLLGMGGSSLGATVLHRCFGTAPGFPEMLVLDSTVPAWVGSVTQAIDPDRTLFIVSSKSGTTAEPNMLYSHFQSAVEQVTGPGLSGPRFIAITDPGTPLDRLAEKEGFRRIFHNPSDVGGRYSILSYFGLVPGALLGIDIGELLRSAMGIHSSSTPSTPCAQNPSAWLGAVLGVAASTGRDKVSLVTSPSIASFGLWAEQLIAESSGKQGIGIVPVAGEPLLTPEQYGADRLFVYLRLDDDDNLETDTSLQRLNASGHPLVWLALHDRYELGGEFFRWQLAMAVAGHIMSINPFDQPNVQYAKGVTAKLLTEFRRNGKLPSIHDPGNIRRLLDEAGPGDYLAIMAYLHERPETDAVLAELRSSALRHRRLATTIGYGPRLLHSTGQLHKGGPNRGLFLQITAERSDDIPIPGQPYSFGTLVDAQAIGDLQALQSAGRRVTSVRLPTDDPSELLKLIDSLE